MHRPPWTRLVDLTLELVAPSRCAACDTPVDRGGAFCAPCEDTVEPPPPEPLEGLPLFAAARFAGGAARAVHRLKYEDRPDLARPLGHFLVRALPPHLPRADVIVPVPLHPHRLAERKYNQSALLATGVARALGIRVAPRGLRRVRQTAQQARLDRTERQENVRAAFAANGNFSGLSVILIDDVVTTGETVRACAEALERTCAHVVFSVAVARAARAASGLPDGVKVI